MSLENEDLEALLNMRDWLEDAIKAKGAQITDAGIGLGYGDIGFELEGMPFSVSIKPRLTSLIAS